MTSPYVMETRTLADESVPITLSHDIGVVEFPSPCLSYKPPPIFESTRPDTFRFPNRAHQERVKCITSRMSQPSPHVQPNSTAASRYFFSHLQQDDGPQPSWKKKNQVKPIPSDVKLPFNTTRELNKIYSIDLPGSLSTYSYSDACIPNSTSRQLENMCYTSKALYVDDLYSNLNQRIRDVDDGTLQKMRPLHKNKTTNTKIPEKELLIDPAVTKRLAAAKFKKGHANTFFEKSLDNQLEKLTGLRPVQDRNSSWHYIRDEPFNPENYPIPEATSWGYCPIKYDAKRFIQDGSNCASRLHRETEWILSRTNKSWFQKKPIIIRNSLLFKNEPKDKDLDFYGRQNYRFRTSFNATGSITM